MSSYIGDSSNVKYKGELLKNKDPCFQHIGHTNSKTNLIHLYKRCDL